MKVPKSHPRYASLVARDRIADGVKSGITSPQGLVAQGRGETFDYFIGERTTEWARMAERVAAAAMLIAEQPIISINGNVAALCPKEAVKLWKTLHEIRLKNAEYGIPERAGIEVNLFHRSEKRVRAIVEHLQRSYNGKLPGRIYGTKPTRRIPGLEHARALSSDEGVYGADVVLVPLEDGDRAEKLVQMGKTVIAIDLNPLSRTSMMATITIVDNVMRAIPSIEAQMRELSGRPKSELERIISRYDNKNVLSSSINEMKAHLEALERKVKDGGKR